MMYFGQHSTSATESGEFTATINDNTYVYVHESYGLDGPNFDVCLIHLINGQIDGTEGLFDIANGTGHASSVQAACLPNAEGLHGDACWIAGWGAVERRVECYTV